MTRRSLCTAIAAAAAALAAGLSAQAYDFQAAHNYSTQRNGHALVVAIDGQIVYERYDNGWAAGLPHRLASGTKSFNGVLLAMAIEDGLVSSFDELVVQAIPEWATDPNKSQITYRQLISLQSGIPGGPNGLAVSYAQAINAPAVAPPGQVFDYGPVPFQIFGEAMKRKLAPRGKTVADYIQERLLSPLGMLVPIWIDWGIGEPRLPGGARTTAREWLKFGEMVRRGGVHNGTRLVSQALLDECFRRSPANVAYGVSWWLPGPGSSEPDDQVAAQGSGKQRLIVIRSHRMVIVRHGESSSWNDERFMRELMPAAFAAFGQGCAGTAGVPTLAAAAGSLPWVGSRFDVDLTNLPPLSLGVLWLGGSNQRYLGLPLPLDLTGIGMVACPLLVGLDASVPFATLGGATTVGLPIPNDPTLATYSIYLQASVLDPLANPLGITMSSGGVARLGAQ